MTGSKHGRRSQISDLNVFPLWIMLLFMRVVSQCVICRITHADHLTFTICFSFLYLKQVFQLRCSGGSGHDLNPVLSDRACFHFTSLWSQASNKFRVSCADSGWNICLLILYCSSKRYGACVIKLTNLLWLVVVLSLQCSLLAHFYPREEMGHTKEKKNLCFLTATHCNASLERCCSVCSFDNLQTFLNT